MGEAMANTHKQKKRRVLEGTILSKTATNAKAAGILCNTMPNNTILWKEIIDNSLNNLNQYILFYYLNNNLYI